LYARRRTREGWPEGEGGYFRRNHLVPVPQVASLEELNVLLLEASKKDEQRMIGERSPDFGVNFGFGLLANLIFNDLSNVWSL
jgi:hypothetical protein